MADDRIGATMEDMHLYEHNGTVWQVPHTTPMTMMGDGFFDSIGNAMGMATHDAEMRNGEMNMLGNAADAMSDDEEMMGRPAKRQMTSYPHSTTTGEQLFEKLGKRHVKKATILQEIVGPRSAQGLITISAQFVPINEEMLLPAHSLAFAVDGKKPGHVRIGNHNKFLTPGSLPIVGVTLEDALDASTLMKEHESRRTVAIGVAGVVALHCPTIHANEFSFGDDVYVTWGYAEKYQNVDILMPTWRPASDEECVFCRIGTFVEQIDAQRGGIRLKLDIGQWTVQTFEADEYGEELPPREFSGLGGPSREVSNTLLQPGLSTQSGDVSRSSSLESGTGASEQRAIADQEKELAAANEIAAKKAERLIAQAAQQLEREEKKKASLVEAQRAAQRVLAKIRETPAQKAKQQPPTSSAVSIEKIKERNKANRDKVDQERELAKRNARQALEASLQQLKDLSITRGSGQGGNAMLQRYNEIIDEADKLGLSQDLYDAFVDTMKATQGDFFGYTYDALENYLIPTAKESGTTTTDMINMFNAKFDGKIEPVANDQRDLKKTLMELLTKAGCNNKGEGKAGGGLPENNLYCQLLVKSEIEFIGLYAKKLSKEDKSGGLPTPSLSATPIGPTDAARDKAATNSLRETAREIAQTAQQTANDFFQTWTERALGLLGNPN